MIDNASQNLCLFTLRRPYNINVISVCIVVAEPFVQPLNHSVVLLKESDIFDE
jgi:hypothetical protein